MRYLGVDVGSEYTKAVLLVQRESGTERVGGLVPTGLDMGRAAEAAIGQVLARAGITRNDVSAVGATGAGAKAVVGADQTINEYSAAALGACFLVPSARTVLDAGSEEARGVRCEGGRVISFASNEKCAAGAGSFVQTMAKAIEVDVPEFIRLSLQSTAKIPLNAQCVIFAESEVVSLIHSDVLPGDIAKAVHDAMAERIGAVLRRVGLRPDIVAVGGLALNEGFLHALRTDLSVEINVAPDPQHASALGAALSVARLDGARQAELVGAQRPQGQEG